MSARAARLDTPIGPLTALVDDAGALTHLLFARQAPPAGVRWDDGCASHVRAQLEEYFRGERREFDLPLAPAGTPFQQTVWRALLQIPYGTTLDYRELGMMVGRPGGARAAGRANATNPIPIIIPCHRVRGAYGDLTGYGGGLDVKWRLLALEGCEMDGERVSSNSWMAVTHPDLYVSLTGHEPLPPAPIPLAHLSEAP